MSKAKAKSQHLVITDKLVILCQNMITNIDSPVCFNIEAVEPIGEWKSELFDHEWNHIKQMFDSGNGDKVRILIKSGIPIIQYERKDEEEKEADLPGD